MCWTICVLRTQLDSISVGKLIVKTAEYGLLKTHVHCMKIPYILQRRGREGVLYAVSREGNIGTTVN